jgi:hypothetical protein
VLPDAGGPPPGRMNASGACQAVQERVAAFEAEQLPLARFRQLRIDAYGAQHAGDPTPPIRVVYGLVGLHLALERRISGEGVRLAHSLMGKPRADWPRLEPGPPADVTVLDVAEEGVDAGSCRGHAEGILRWGTSVWAAWAPAHDEVAALTRRLFTADAPFWGSRDLYRP